MKSKTKLLFILFILITLVSTTIYATDTVNDSNVSTTSSDTDDLEETDEEIGETNLTQEPEIEYCDKYITGEDVTIDTLIDGNVFVVGKNVTLTGGIARDLFVIAENFKMEQDTVIYGNLFVLASDITIDGAVYQIYAACDKMNLDYYGDTQADLKVMAKEVSIDGVVRRHAYIDADKVIINTYGEIQGDLCYTSQSEAVYREKVQSDDENEEDTVREITEIPVQNVAGEKKFTKRDKKIYSNDKEIISSVQKIIKDTKDMDGEKLKATVMANIYSNLGVKANSEMLKKGASKTFQIPKIYVYIDIVVIILLIMALVIPRVIKAKKNTSDNKKTSDNK